MRGHVRERGNGHWYAVIDMRDGQASASANGSLPDARENGTRGTACGKLIADMTAAPMSSRPR